MKKMEVKKIKNIRDNIRYTINYICNTSYFTSYARAQNPTSPV